MTPSQAEIIETLKRGYAHFNRGEFDQAAELLHPEVELVPPGGQPPIVGAGAFRAWMEPDAFEEQQMEPLDFAVSDRHVLVRTLLKARGAGSGIEIKMDLWIVWTVDSDGVPIRVKSFLPHEEADARREAGLAD